MIELRPYQQTAKAAVYEHQRTRTDRPLVVIPTGGGTTRIIASICEDAVGKWGCRVLIVEPRYELAIRLSEKLHAHWPELAHWGGREGNDQVADIVIDSIESVERRASSVDSYDIVILADAHLILPYYDKAYRQLVSNIVAINSDAKFVGFAAMPDRLKIGTICTAEPICSPDGHLNHLCFEVGIRDLIDAGFLTPVVTKTAVHQIETEMLPLFGSDFNSCEAADLIDQPKITQAVCAELIASTCDRQAVLIFPTGGGIPAMSVAYCLKSRHEIQAPLISTVMGYGKRAELTAKFRAGSLKYVIIDDLLATDFYTPHVDCVVVLRPTLSAGMYTHMAAQGVRKHPGKKNCLVLDFVGNALRHGPIDQFTGGVSGRTRAGACHRCRSVFAINGTSCPHCRGEILPPKYRRIVVFAPKLGLPTAAEIITEHAVRRVTYAVHVKKNAPAGAPKSMRADYNLGYGKQHSEFICFEHTGYARKMAEQWWRTRSREPIPSTAERAVAIANKGGIAHAAHITVSCAAGEKYSRIVAYELVLPSKSIPIAPTSDEQEVASDAGR